MRNAVLLMILIFAQPVFADWAENYPVGSDFPEISAEDQTKQVWTNSKLIGANGLIFFVNRSTSW
jgi:hypothetical protein